MLPFLDLKLYCVGYLKQKLGIVLYVPCFPKFYIDEGKSESFGLEVK